jgi:hypothetical protein
MSDLRNLDLTATDGGLKTNTLVRNCIPLLAGQTYNQEFIGFFSNTAAALDWTITGIDAKASVAFTPKDSTLYNIHASAITLPAGADGHGYLPGWVYRLVDDISTWTLTGTQTTTSDILTVAVGNSSDLNAGSSVLPVVGHRYNYTYTITTFDSAAKALMTYGGVDIYDEAVAGSYTGTITATAPTGLEIDIDVVAVADFVMTGMQITRA